MTTVQDSSQSVPALLWVLCFLLPPVGLCVLWCSRQKIRKVQLALATFVGAVSLISIVCMSFIVATLLFAISVKDEQPAKETVHSSEYSDTQDSRSTSINLSATDAKQVGSNATLLSGSGSFAIARTSYINNLNDGNLGNVREVAYFFMGKTDMITGFKMPPEHESEAHEAVLMFKADVEMAGQPSLRGERQFSINFQRVSSGWRVTNRQVYFGGILIDLTGDASTLLPSGNFPK